MAFKALLTLDLDGVSDKQRNIFYDYLEQEKWVKINDIDTAWKCRFNAEMTRLSALNTSKADIKEASRLAKISSVKSVIQLGEGDVEEF